MTLRLVVVALTLAAGLGIAWAAQRRRPAPPTNPDHAVPVQLDRLDFARPDARWLVVVFTSNTCDTCGEAWTKALTLASDEVAVQEVEVSAHADLHRRYRVEAVPMTLLADAGGAVRRSFLGPVPVADLWAEVSSARDDDPG